MISGSDNGSLSLGRYPSVAVAINLSPSRLAKALQFGPFCGILLGPTLEMALLHYTLEQLQLYLKWALSKHGEFTPEPTIQPYPGIFIGDLSQLNSLKRNAFSAVVGILFVLAFVGNLSTLYVNSRRKLRPFFRSCLISLACSDLSSTVFCTISYMAQFNAEYLQLWVSGKVQRGLYISVISVAIPLQTIGGFMCKFVPFVTTTSVLSGSLTLVAIALDRYLAIMRPVLGLWNPDYRFSVVTMLLIWACSIGASGPLLGIYDFQHVYLLDAEDNKAEGEDNNAEVPEELVVTELELVHMCLAGDVSPQLGLSLGSGVIKWDLRGDLGWGNPSMLSNQCPPYLISRVCRKQFMQFYKYFSVCCSSMLSDYTT